MNFSDTSLNLSAWLRKSRFAGSLPVLIKILAPKKNDVILDVGAGMGVIADEIANYCDDVFALEPNPKRVEFIKKKYPEVKAFIGTAEAIQFPESYFSKAYVIGVLHHFKDKQVALFEIGRVLKHGGLLVIKDSEPGAMVSKFESLAAGVKFISSEILKEKLESSGFEVRELKRVGGGRYFLSANKV